MNNQDFERNAILADIPDVEETIKQTTPDYNPGSGWWKVPKGNAWIGKTVHPDGQAFLEIWPDSGGYLEVPINQLGADIAPFHG